ncbi:MAG: PEP-CTERM sorting domain-containing protein [Planctomycetes bacterium]|nr:PEP-CTERM sorting domain-containing protein [Planctomycetota bacterium]
MQMRITSRLAVWAITQLLLGAGTSLANTVNLVHDGYGAYEIATLWGGGMYGAQVESGVYLLNKTGDTGLGNTWHNGLIPAFCIELNEPVPAQAAWYTVGMPEDMVVSYTGDVLGTTKANYLRELWARYYDPSWAQGGSTPQADRSAAAFALAVWEIIYEGLPSSRWDVTTDNTPGLEGFIALNADVETANKWLQTLTGTGPKADLRVFTVNGSQNYLVAVPEPATIVLLGLGGLCSVFRRRRRMGA